MAGAVPALMSIGIGEDADAVALFEGVMHQPFEGAPVGMHFDRALDPGVVRHLDVGVASADMREDDAILALQRVEQLLRAVRVARQIVLIVDQGVRGTVDLSAFLHEEDVAIAAESGVARPFVARKDDEPPIFVKGAGEIVELVPEGGGDLEIIALVAHAVEKGPVARELDQLSRRVGTDRLLRLPV